VGFHIALIKNKPNKPLIATPEEINHLNSRSKAIKKTKGSVPKSFQLKNLLEEIEVFQMIFWIFWVFPFNFSNFFCFNFFIVFFQIPLIFLNFSMNLSIFSFKSPCFLSKGARNQYFPFSLLSSQRFNRQIHRKSLEVLIKFAYFFFKTRKS